MGKTERKLGRAYLWKQIKTKIPKFTNPIHQRKGETWMQDSMVLEKRVEKRTSQKLLGLKDETAEKTKKNLRWEEREAGRSSSSTCGKVESNYARKNMEI